MYCNASSKASCPLLNINAIGYSDEIQITRYGPAQRDWYIIHYVLSGKGYFNGAEVKAGQGFLITPQMPEHYYPDKQEPWTFLWVISNDPKMADLFPRYQADPDTHIFSFEPLHAVIELSDILIRKGNGTCDSFELLEYFLSLFKYTSGRQDQKEPVTNAEIYLNAAVNYIELNLHRSITVSELTGFLGISQPYLFRIFRNRFGCSPKHYILKQKFSHAQHLLQETDLTVTQIAASVGFEDVQSFSKFFSTRAGLPPRAFRKKDCREERIDILPPGTYNDSYRKQ